MREFKFKYLASHCAMLATLILLVSLGSSCQSGTVSGTETGKKVSLSGRVVDGNDRPLSGIVTKLARNGFADTTDALGRFQISGEGTTVAGGKGILDTLIILRDGQRVISLGITRWVDTLPDIILVQRTIAGLLLANGLEVGRVEAVLETAGSSGNRASKSELFFNSPAEEYSGFFYFPASVSQATFRVFVNIYDNQGVWIGRSENVTFTSLAGDITIPPLNLDSGTPPLRAIAGKDTAVDAGTSVTLVGRYFSAFGPGIAEYAWRVAPDTGFTTRAGGLVTIMAPPEIDSCVTAILRVTDSAGHSAFDTIQVRAAAAFDALLKQPWRLAAAASPGNFSSSYKPQVLVFQDAIWVIGRNGRQTEIWRSEDGKGWTVITKEAPIGPHAELSAFVHQNRIWVLTSDVIDLGIHKDLPRTNYANSLWSSGNGKDWELVIDSVGFPHRFDAKVSVFREKIWVIGGRDATTFSMYQDIWSSSDGKKWDLAVADAKFLNQFSLSVTRDRLSILNPTDSLDSGPAFYDSEDGKTWRKTQATGQFPSGFERSEAVEIDGRLVFLGVSDRVYYFPPNHCCLESTEAIASFPIKSEFAALTYKSKTFIVGGFGLDAATDLWHPSSEVWYWMMP